MSEAFTQLLAINSQIAANALDLTEAAENMRLWAFTPANGGPNQNGMVTLTIQGQQIVVASREKIEADGLRGIQGEKGEKGDQGNQGPAGNINNAPASAITSGVFDIARIPVLPSQLQFTSSGGLANLTTAQQNAIGQGSIVTTTDGFRWVYNGSGSKTAAGSYTQLADITPTWGSVAEKPSSFPSTIPEVVGLTTALNSKSATGHAHAWSEITDKPLTFAPSAHSHVWADLTDKPTTFTPAAHTQDWSTITAKPDLVINGQPSITARGANGNGHTIIAGGNADYTGSIGFHQGDGTRLGYIGGAHSSNKYIPMAGENGGIFYFNQRPLFIGQTPWDSGNLSPVTTNNTQTIFARKVFKDTSGGTTATANYADKGLEVQSLSASDDALMSFHIPGVRAAVFGLSSASGDWQVGTSGGAKNLWHSGNFDPSNKFNTSGGSLTGNVTLVNGADRSITLGSSTNYTYQLTTAGDHFQIREASDPAKVRFQISYPTGQASFAVRPTWAGTTPWDTGNFDPSSKAATSHTHDWGQVTGKPYIPTFLQASTSGQMRIYDTNGNQRLHFYADPDGYGFLNPSAGGWSLRINSSSIYFTASGTERTMWHSGNFDPSTKQKTITNSQGGAPTGGVDGDVHIIW